MLRVHRCLLALTSFAFVVSMSLALLHAQAPKTPTVWDGAYTDAQAERATAAFSANCSRCHTLTVDGSGNRPLTGDKFWEGYTQKTVGDLLKFVSTNMPNGAAAGSLSASTYNDLVALILKSNGFPSGKTEVAPETVADIQIIPKGGAGELPANTLVKMVGCLGPKSGSDWTLVNATDPVRIDKTGAVPEDTTRPLGTRTITLKFVLTRLDTYAGQRVSVSGILMGAGGANGINVSTVNRVAEACP
jgi:mono/diheme cytochrome c family protein